jgi:putative aldouronate transport system substrate-binding protein
MYMKRIVCTLFCAVLTASFVMAAGRNQAGSSSSTEATSLIAKGTLPLTKADVTFTVLASSPGGVVTSYDYKDNLFTKKITDQTGVKLDIITAPSADFNTRLNAMLNTGTYPDIILNGIGWSSLDYYYNQGIIISLDKYDPLSYSKIKAAFDEYPIMNSTLKSTGGQLLALPAVNDCLHCTFSNGRAWYHMPWVRDKYGFKIPETLQDLDAYLRYVKTNDMNGNGNRNDEIPMAFDNMKSAVSFITKSFMPWNNDGFALRNGKVWEQYKENDFREALKVLAGWYRDGLIAQNSLSMSGDELRALGEAETPIVAVIPHAWSNNFTTQPGDRWIDTWQMPMLKGPAGQRWGANNEPTTIGGPGFIITDKCKDPALAIALYDYLIDYEVELDSYIGPKGVAWTDADSGSKGLNGLPARYKLLITFASQAVNGSWNQASPMIRNSAFRLGEQATDTDMVARWFATGDASLKVPLLANNSFNEQMNYKWAKDMQEWAIPWDYVIPPVVLAEADQNRVADIRATLAGQRDTAWAEFIAGIRDINSDSAWNTYLRDLDSLGAAELASIYQKYIK